MIVRTSGADLFYSPRGAGTTIVVPCLLGIPVYEELIVPPLRDRFRFVYVDLRGGGRSTGDPNGLAFDVLAADLEAVRRDVGADRVAVLGYSIVGMLAVEYGRRCPAHVSHVIVAGTPPSGDLARLAARSASFFEQDASEERKAILRENMAALPPGTPPTRAIFAQTPMRFFDARFDARPLFANADFKPALFERVMTLAAGWDVTKGIESLTVPILVAHGRYDYAAPHVMWKGIVDRLPDGTLRLFERSGHQPFFEEPERFLDVLMEWMARSNARVGRSS